MSVDLFSNRYVCVLLFISDMAKWDSPSGGMFLWMSFPDLEDTAQFTIDLVNKHRVIIANGGMFETSPDMKSNRVRISYSIASDESLEKVMCLYTRNIHQFARM